MSPLTNPFRKNNNALPIIPTPAVPDTPEVSCLQSLVSLNEVQGSYAKPQRTNNFFKAVTGVAPPADLRTSIHTTTRADASFNTLVALATPPPTEPGQKVVSSTTVSFHSQEDLPLHLSNMDWVQTPQSGLQLQYKDWSYNADGERNPHYVAQLGSRMIGALKADAETIQQKTIEVDTELLKLGELVEPADATGNRRFHIGDILSITTGRLLSPRHVDGVYDITGYMTNDAPFTTQLPRFAEECAPSLNASYGALLKPYDSEYDKIEDAADVYRLLGKITAELKTSFLPVQRLEPTKHAILDHLDELELDYGPDIKKKFIQIELSSEE